MGSRGRSYGFGASLCSVALVVPLVFGVVPSPREMSFGDNVAWLANEAEGDLVRLNVETGRVDARVALEGLAGSFSVGQVPGSVFVKAGDKLRAVDLATLSGGAEVSVEGDLFVGEDVAYVVSSVGTVKSLDPRTLDVEGEVDLGGSVSRAPVVAGSRLVVPVEDGSVAVLDGDEVVGRLGAGREGHLVAVALVGDEAVAVNLSEGSLRRFDPSRKKVRSEGAVGFDAPEGSVLLADSSPEGRLWLAAVDDGELVGVDLEDGDSVSVGVSSGGNELVGPVAVRDRVYLIDKDDRVVVEVDVSGPEVVERRPVEFDDPDAVEMLVVGDSVVINDRSSASAVVVDGNGGYVEVDKYSDDGVAVPLPDVDLVGVEIAHPSEPGADAPSDAPPGQAPVPPAGQDDRRPPRDERPDRQPSPPTTLPPVATTTTTTVPGVDPPGVVGGLSADAGDRRVSLSWSAPSGAVDDYVIEVFPPISGQTSFTSAAPSYTFTSLANGTTYSFTVTARNEGGAGAGAEVSATPGRAPTVSGVNAERSGDREFSVSFSYDAGGRAVDTCTVTRGGTTHQASCSGGTGTVSGLTVGTYNTSYTFTANVGTTLGSNQANATARSANKPLTVDADPNRFAVWNGVCTWNPDEGGQPNTRPYFATTAHNCPRNAGGPAGYLNDRTAVRATCRTRGDSVTDDQSNESSMWVRIDGYGYMNTLWFTNWNNNPEANLPAC